MNWSSRHFYFNRIRYTTPARVVYPFRLKFFEPILGLFHQPQIPKIL